MCRVVAAGCAVVGLLFCTPSAVGAQPAPTIALNPASGVPGTTVTATGSTCTVEDVVPSGESPAPAQPDKIELYWDDGTFLASGAVDSTTSTYTATFAVPDGAAAGDHTVVARCPTGADATAVFTVGSGTGDGSFDAPTLALDPGTGSVGEPITASGQSCGVVAANGRDVDADALELYWEDGSLLAAGEVDAETYAYTATFAVPDGAVPGEHSVSARCVTSGDSTTTAFTVRPSAPPSGDENTGEDTEQSNTNGNPNNGNSSDDPATSLGVTDTGGQWPPAGEVLVLIGIVVLVLLGVLLARMIRRKAPARPGSVQVRAGVAPAPTMTLIERAGDRRRVGFRLGLGAHRDRGTYVVREIDR